MAAAHTLGLSQLDVAVLDHQVLVGWDYIYVVGLDPNCLVDLGNGNFAVGLEHRGEIAFVLWRQMQYHNESRSAVRGNVAEELLERGNAARRTADAHNQRTGLPGTVGR